MLFKLGKKATLFVDTASGKKLIKLKDGEEPQTIELSPKEMRSQRVKTAIQNRHIIKCDAKGKADDEDLDLDEPEDETGLVSQKEFEAMKVPDMKTYILSNFDLDDEEGDEIDDLKKPDLIERYAELVKAKAEKADEEDDDDDNGDDDDDDDN